MTELLTWLSVEDNKAFVILAIVVVCWFAYAFVDRLKEK